MGSSGLRSRLASRAEALPQLERRERADGFLQYRVINPTSKVPFNDPTSGHQRPGPEDPVRQDRHPFTLISDFPATCCRAVRLAVLAVLASGLLLLSGCGKGELTKIVHGTVAVGNEKVDTGHVRFVPIDGTPGPSSTGRITDGEYRIEARGGVPLGKHRVEVNALKKTGRMVRGHTGFERGMVEETVRVGPERYAGADSPLVIEVTADSDARIDFQIPDN